MKDTKYLYGNLDPLILDTQKSVAKAKLEACAKLLKEILEVPFEARDDERLEAVIKAQKFNQKLLDEVV